MTRAISVLAPAGLVLALVGASPAGAVRLRVAPSDRASFTTSAAPAAEISIASPNGRLAVAVSAADGRLTYRATFGGRPVIEPSPLGIVVDAVNLGQDVTVGRLDRYRTNETYAWAGVHSTSVDRSNGARVAIEHRPSRTTYQVDVRAFDDAVAVRCVVPGGGRRVPDAAIEFRLPAGALVWSHDLVGHYEGVYARKRVEEVQDGEWAAPPVTFKLPAGGGYAAITEAGLENYAGMVLQGDGRGAFRERLGHSPPPSHPFTLRYGDQEAARLSAPAAIDGPITTPWRVVVVGADLNALVNSDAIHNLAPPPDKRLFPDGSRTSWLRPGRAVWRYLDGGENTLDGIREFSRLAGELGFEYQVVEGIWQRWTEAELADLIAYSKQRGVGIILWRHRNTLHDAAARRQLFSHLHDIGAAGLKIDFFDHEAKEVIDLYHSILRDAAEFHLVLDFHGANKPAGESRTWPNEVTREGIYGLEHRNMPAWAAFNTTWPFARLLAGHADYTPMVFGDRRKETSLAHQIASAAILTSPLLVFGANPSSMLSSPAADVIKGLPSVWDETRVLPPSEIGELAMFARRRGDRWFVAAMNGPAAQQARVSFSFLGPGAYEATIVRDSPDDAAALEVERKAAARSESVTVDMRAGGGFIIRLMPGSDPKFGSDPDQRPATSDTISRAESFRRSTRTPLTLNRSPASCTTILPRAIAAAVCRSPARRSPGM